MSNAVFKGNSLLGVTALIYFLLSIALVGAVLAYGLVVPLYILGYLLPPAKKLADRVMVKGIQLLMTLQPWLSADIQLNLPQGGRGCLLVSNHRSHLDAFILLSRVQGIRILAKSSLFRIPFLGLLMRLSKQIPTKRGDLKSFQTAMDEVRTKLDSGEVVHVFAEMTRCETGFRGLKDFSVAPFKVALEGNFPIIPIVFQGTDEVWPKSALSLQLRRPVRVTALDPLAPREFHSSFDLMSETRHRIEQVLLA